MKEAILYDKLDDGKVVCNVCRHRCRIAPERTGVCKTRVNIDGALFSTIYGKVSSVHVNPIEKKPLFHFYPGSLCFSMGTVGCDFQCPGCQNWEISRLEATGAVESLPFISAAESVDMAIRSGCQGISWTFNEPAIWLEYTMDSARIAKERGLYTAYVTNGFITPEALDALSPYLDAYRVDIKAFSDKAYKRITGVKALEGVLESARLAKKKHRMHVECVTNVTPAINDDEDELRGLAEWIRDTLGPDTPWHVTRFYPYLDLSHIPATPIMQLEAVRQIGMNAGLHFVYLGNVPGHAGENTCCHRCGELLIERSGFEILSSRLTGSRCPSCGTAIYGSFDPAELQPMAMRQPRCVA